MKSQRHARQGFLGPRAQEAFKRTVVGVVGLGGGGCHIVQQLAHIGFDSFILADPDTVEESNLNRMVGATAADAKKSLRKIQVAERVIRGLNPAANIQAFSERWQTVADSFKFCDVIVGCVDGFAERHQLESHARRYLIPYIDIGMDVLTVDGRPPSMFGQVILSVPGKPCMWCLGFLTEEKLTREAKRYGEAGDNPQVVWPNGVLASTAVGILVDLFTHWTRNEVPIPYFTLDGNKGTLIQHVRAEFAPAVCTHYPLTQTGEPLMRPA